MIHELLRNHPWFVAEMIGLAVLVGLARVLASMRRPTAPASPYRRKGSLFSRDERRFYDALRAAAAERYLIFAQMRLVDLVEAPRGSPAAPYWFAKLRYKHVDFVLCDPESSAPLLAIELDGASHDSDLQRRRDAEKDAVLRQAGLPLLRVATQKAGYRPRALAEAIESALRQ